MVRHLTRVQVPIRSVSSTPWIGKVQLLNKYAVTDSLRSIVNDVNTVAIA